MLWAFKSFKKTQAVVVVLDTTRSSSTSLPTVAGNQTALKRIHWIYA
jgi:hypothetical protein